MTSGTLLLIAAVCLATGIVVGWRVPAWWLGLVVIAAVAGLVAAGTVLLGAAPAEWQSPWLIGGQPIHLRLDGVSAFFLALLAVGGGTGAVYARGYWNDHEYPRSAPHGRMWWSVMLLSMGFVLLSSNGLHFLIAWEIFALASYFLITLDRQNRDVRAAGWLYLAASHAGTLCLFAFFALLASRTGSWDLHAMRDHPELAPLFWVAFAGFAVKAGLFPVHVWLPSAHANAPSHVSALMSGVAIKMGVYGIVRFSGWLPVPAPAGWVVMSIGAITALLGIAFALGQNDLKRLLAYSSVENIGIMFIGIGGGLLGVTYGNAAWGRLALAGALLHVWNHGLFKSLLFYGAGSVLHATGTREMSRLGGLWRNLPWTAALFALGAMAVSALPPFNGFVSEWLIYLGLFDTVTGHTAAAWVAMPATIMLGVTGALALAAFVKASATIFLGAPRKALPSPAHEAGWWMRAPMVIVAAACVTIGLMPLLVWPAVIRAVAAWNAPWGADASATPLVALGPVQVGFAAILVMGVALLWRRAHRHGWERRPTWDCGYALPTARMQYTSGSFAEIATGWFAWILAPERKLRRPRGIFPVEANRMERIPEAVLERVIAPIGRVILVVAAAARRLQHGRLQYYIAYVVVALAGLTALVATGARR